MLRFTCQRYRIVIIMYVMKVETTLPLQKEARILQFTNLQFTNLTRHVVQIDWFPSQQSQGLFQGLDLGGNLYLGGLEKYDAPDAANARTGFVGKERKLI